MPYLASKLQHGNSNWNGKGKADAAPLPPIELPAHISISGSIQFRGWIYEDGELASFLPAFRNGEGFSGWLYAGDLAEAFCSICLLIGEDAFCFPGRGGLIGFLAALKDQFKIDAMGRAELIAEARLLFEE